MERRKYTRKLLDPIHVANMVLVDRLMFLARYGTILNASAAGLLIAVCDHDLSPDLLQPTRSFTAFKGEKVTMKIVEMQLDIVGRLMRFHRPARQDVEIGIDLTDSAPSYWRECLADLLPSAGEIESIGVSWRDD